MRCLCGHEQAEHVYGEGPCRPGRVCARWCSEFRQADPLEGWATSRGVGVDAGAQIHYFEQDRPSCNLDGIHPGEWRPAFLVEPDRVCLICFLERRRSLVRASHRA